MSLLHVLYGFIYITVLFLIMGFLGYLMISNLRVSTLEFAFSAVLFTLICVFFSLFMIQRM